MVDDKEYPQQETLNEVKKSLWKNLKWGRNDFVLWDKLFLIKQATPPPCLFLSEPIISSFSIGISEDTTESSNFDSEMPITAASLSLSIYWSWSIFGGWLLMLICTEWRPLYLKNSPLIIIMLLRTINRSWITTNIPRN